jgi:hypothetical protein
MSWGGPFSNLNTLIALISAQSLFMGAPVWAQQVSQATAGSGAPSIAVIQYTPSDLDRAAKVAESRIRSSIDLGRMAQDQIPESLIRLEGSEALQEVLDLLETQSGQSVQLAVRVPRGGVQLKSGVTGLQVLHQRGSPRLDLQVKTEPSEVQVRGIQVGYLVKDSEGQEQFVALTDGTGAQNREIPAAQLDLKVQEAKLSAQIDLPERGTDIRLASVQPEVRPEHVDLKIQLPTALNLELTQGTKGQSGSGKIKIELNEQAMALIQEQAEKKTLETLLLKANELTQEQQKKIREKAQEEIEKFRAQFSLARELRLPMESETRKATQQILAGLAARKSSPPLLPEDAVTAGNSQALAVLRELTQTFSLASPEKFEMMGPEQTSKESPLYLSTRLAILHTFMANLTQDWDHFIRFSGLDPKNKTDKEKIKKLKSLKEDLLDHLGSRKSHEDLARFIEVWGGTDGRDEHHHIDLWLKLMAPTIESFIKNGGLRRSDLLETNHKIHDILLRSRLQKTATIQINEDGTRLRDQVIALQGSLSTLNSKIQMPIPGCDSRLLTGKEAESEAMRISTSLSAVNALAKRLHEEGTLELMLAKQPGIKLLEAPQITAGKRDKNAKPGALPLGLKDGVFTLKAKIEAQDEEFDIEVVGRLAPEKGGKSMSLEILEVQSLDHNPGFLKTIFPVTLLFKVLPIALFGQSFVDGMLDDKKAKGENKLVFDIPESISSAGFLIQGFETDPEHLDRMSAIIGPGTPGGRP